MKVLEDNMGVSYKKIMQRGVPAQPDRTGHLLSIFETAGAAQRVRKNPPSIGPESVNSLWRTTDGTAGTFLGVKSLRRGYLGNPATCC